MKRHIIFLISLAMVLGMAAAAGAAQLHWQRWQDPREGAFSIAVPAGWKVEGGLMRFAAVDIRPDVLITSPDGMVIIRIGDSVIPPFVVPNQMLAQTGFSEGRWYSPGFGVKFLVMRYLPGSYFMTQWYLPQRVGQVRNVAVRVHRTMAQQLSQYLSQTGMSVRVDIADMTFQTGSNQQQNRRNGYVMIQTRTTGMPGSPMATWEVQKMSGYLCDPRAERLANQVYAGVMNSFQWNPAWFGRQLQAVGAASTAVRKAENEALKIIQSVNKNRQEAFDRANDKWNEYIRGTRTVTTPDGRQMEVQDGFDNYIMTPDGNIYGQNNDMVDDHYAVGQDGNMYKVE